MYKKLSDILYQSIAKELTLDIDKLYAQVPPGANFTDVRKLISNGIIIGK